MSNSEIPVPPDPDPAVRIARPRRNARTSSGKCRTGGSARHRAGRTKVEALRAGNSGSGRTEAA